MITVTDDYMKEMLSKARGYTLVLLRAGSNMGREDVQQILWEHGRKNFQLRADGIMNIVAPVSRESEVVGIAILNTDVDKATEIMNEDPAVKEGILRFEAMPCMSFPGDQLM